jgi:hypothetical protein
MEVVLCCTRIEVIVSPAQTVPIARHAENELALKTRAFVAASLFLQNASSRAPN